MSQKILSKKTKNNLEILSKGNVLENFYLAGGTGLALQLKHRLSLDLDFFTKKDIDTKLLIQKIKKLGKLSVEDEAENTLHINFQGTKITFLKYDYLQLFPLKKFETIQIGDIRDIGCMKISAISSRGTKKDFIDIYFICKKELSLEKLLELFEKKHKGVEYNMIHIMKSLIYFEDAEKDPVPKMIIPVSWKEVKDFLKKQINNYQNKYLKK